MPLMKNKLSILEFVQAAHRTQKGFSLLEMLTVLLLFAIITAVAAPSTGRFLSSLQFRQKAQEVVSVLRYARLMSVTQGENVYVVMNDEGATGFTLSGGVEKVYEFDLEEDDAVNIEPEEIVFFPEGQVTPAHVTFTGGNRILRVSMDPLTALPIIE